LIGLPGQTDDQVVETIEYVGKTGTLPYLSEYSPIPHTGLWKEALAASPFDLGSDPLFHNNSIMPCWDGDVFKRVSRLKKLAQDIREKARKSD